MSDRKSAGVIFNPALAARLLVVLLLLLELEPIGLVDDIVDL